MKWKADLQYTSSIINVPISDENKNLSDEATNLANSKNSTDNY